MQFGLNENIIKKINSVFADYQQIEDVIIYGSRANESNKFNSDIDLTIISKELTFSEFLRIENQLDDLLLPYKIDLSLFRQISNPDIIKHISRIGKIFYSK